MGQSEHHKLIIFLNWINGKRWNVENHIYNLLDWEESHGLVRKWLARGANESPFKGLKCGWENMAMAQPLCTLSRIKRAAKPQMASITSWWNCVNVCIFIDRSHRVGDGKVWNSRASHSSINGPWERKGAPTFHHHIRDAMQWHSSVFGVGDCPNWCGCPMPIGL
jgi:hypothetical protein